jgi:hypothetical protein
MIEHCILPALALIAFCIVAWIVGRHGGDERFW